MTRRRVLSAGRSRVAAVAAAVAGMLAIGSTAAMALPGTTAPGQWPMAGQNINDTHAQPAEHAISPANVGGLTPKWVLTTAGAVAAIPTVYHGAVYVPDFGGKLWALAAGSGRVLWSHTISGYTGVAGDVSRTSPAVYGNELMACSDRNICAPIFGNDRCVASIGRTQLAAVSDGTPGALSDRSADSLARSAWASSTRVPSSGRRLRISSISQISQHRQGLAAFGVVQQVHAIQHQAMRSTVGSPRSGSGV